MKHTLRLVLFSLIAMFALLGASQTAANAEIPGDSDWAVIAHYSPDFNDNRPIPVRCVYGYSSSQIDIEEGNSSDYSWNYDTREYESCKQSIYPWIDGNNSAEQVWVRDNTDLRCMKEDGTWWNKWKATGWHNIVHNGFVYKCIVVPDETPGF